MANPHAVSRSTTGHNVDKRHRLTKAQEWIVSGKSMLVRSSNVRAIWYNKPAQKLFVKFKNGDTYYYPSVTVQKATSFFHAASFGKAVWSLRRSGWKGIKLTGTADVD